MNCSALLVASVLTATGPLDGPVLDSLPVLDDDSRIVERRLELVDGGAVLRFTRTYREAPVLGEVIAVRLSPNGEELYRVGSFSELPTAMRPRIDATEASRAALGHLFRASVDVPTLLHALAVLTKPARMVWVVHIPSAVPQWRRNVLIDAVNGGVIAVRSPVHYAMASVYDPHPEPVDVLGTPSDVELQGLASDATTLSGEWVESRSCLTDDESVRVITCNDIAGGFACLSPDIADLLVAFCGEGFVAQRTLDDDFRYAPVDDASDYQSGGFATDAFAEVNAYYHADRTARFVGALGHPSESVRVLSNVTIPSPALLQCASSAWASSTSRTSDDARAALTGCTATVATDFLNFDNAFFLGDELEFLVGIRSGIYMGQGTTADFAYDGDIVSHEYGHAVEGQLGALLGGVLVDEIGVNVEPGALAEAYADYLAVTLTEDPVMGGYVGGRLGRAAGIRTLDHALVCPDYLEGQVHADSRGFAGALWAARQRYPQTEQRGEMTVRVFDRLVYQALATLSTTSTMSDFAAAIVQEVENEGALADPNAEEVLAVFDARNVLECERIRDLPVPQINLPSGATSEIGGFIGGQSYAPYAPGPFQLRLVSGPTRSAVATFSAVEADATLTFENPEDLLGAIGVAGATQLALLVRFGGPIEFSYSAGADTTTVIVPEAVVEYPLELTGERLSAEIDISGASGREVYAAVVNRGMGLRLRDLTVELGPEVLEETTTGGTPDDGGCAATPGGWWVLLLLRRRRRRV